MLISTMTYDEVFETVLGLCASFILFAALWIVYILIQIEQNKAAFYSIDVDDDTVQNSLDLEVEDEDGQPNSPTKSQPTNSPTKEASVVKKTRPRRIRSSFTFIQILSVGALILLTYLLLVTSNAPMWLSAIGSLCVFGVFLRFQIGDEIRRQRWDRLTLLLSIFLFIASLLSMGVYSMKSLKQGEIYEGPARIVGYDAGQYNNSKHDPSTRTDLFVQWGKDWGCPLSGSKVCQAQVQGAMCQVNTGTRQRRFLGEDAPADDTAENAASANGEQDGDQDAEQDGDQDAEQDENEELQQENEELEAENEELEEKIEELEEENAEEEQEADTEVAEAQEEEKEAEAEGNAEVVEEEEYEFEDAEIYDEELYNVEEEELEDEAENTSNSADADAYKAEEQEYESVEEEVEEAYDEDIDELEDEAEGYEESAEEHEEAAEELEAEVESMPSSEDDEKEAEEEEELVEEEEIYDEEEGDSLYYDYEEDDWYWDEFTLEYDDDMYTSEYWDYDWDSVWGEYACEDLFDTDRSGQTYDGNTPAGGDDDWPFINIYGSCKTCEAYILDYFAEQAFERVDRYKTQSILYMSAAMVGFVISLLGFIKYSLAPPAENEIQLLDSDGGVLA